LRNGWRGEELGEIVGRTDSAEAKAPIAADIGGLFHWWAENVLGQDGSSWLLLVGTESPFAGTTISGSTDLEIKR
jgi:hypothetical protein